MAALIKVYTDSLHTAEVAHTTQNTTTTVGSQGVGTTSLAVASSASMPVQGFIDIIDGVNGNETIAYTNNASNTLVLASATAFTHPAGTTVNQWYYQLNVGDQNLGLINDGSLAGPVSPTNVGTWYYYNAGNQPATNIVISTSNVAPGTTYGFVDSAISGTSASAGFTNSLAVPNLAAGAAAVQFWLAAQVALGQSAVANPQIGIITISYQSV